MRGEREVVCFLCGSRKVEKKKQNVVFCFCFGKPRGAARTAGRHARSVSLPPHRLCSRPQEGGGRAPPNAADRRGIRAPRAAASPAALRRTARLLGECTPADPARDRRQEAGGGQVRVWKGRLDRALTAHTPALTRLPHSKHTQHYSGGTGTPSSWPSRACPPPLCGRPRLPHARARQRKTQRGRRRTAAARARCCCRWDEHDRLAWRRGRRRWRQPHHRQTQSLPPLPPPFSRHSRRDRHEPPRLRPALAPWLPCGGRRRTR